MFRISRIQSESSSRRKISLTISSTPAALSLESADSSVSSSSVVNSPVRKNRLWNIFERWRLDRRGGFSGLLRRVLKCACHCLSRSILSSTVTIPLDLRESVNCRPRKLSLTIASKRFSIVAYWIKILLLLGCVHCGHLTGKEEIRFERGTDNTHYEDKWVPGRPKADTF